MDKKNNLSEMGALLYKGKYSFDDFSWIISWNAMMITFQIMSHKFADTWCVNIVFTFLLLVLVKQFDVYKHALVIRYPSFIFIKPRVVDLSLVKKIVFKYKGKGSGRMVVVYENTTSKYWFLDLSDMCKIFRLLRSLEVQLEVDKDGWKC